MPRWLDTDVPASALVTAGAGSGGNEVSANVSSATWHPRLPLIAVLSSPLSATAANAVGTLCVLSATAEPLATLQLASPATTPTAVWHLTRRALLVGHDSGAVTVWLETKSATTPAAATAHKAAVVAATWISSSISPTNSNKDLKFASADADGVVVVWRVDPATARATKVCDYRMPQGAAVVTLLPFRQQHQQPTSAAPESKKGDAKKGSTPCAFLVVTTSNLTVLADDPTAVSDASSSPLFSVPATTSIARVLISPIGSAATATTDPATGEAASARQVVVVLCENGQLSMLTVADGQRIASMQQVKVGVGSGAFAAAAAAASGANGSSATPATRPAVPWSTAWIAPGMVAVCNGGGVVRIVDFVGDEGVSLELEDTEDARINSISFDPTRNRLAAGTDSGHLVLWQARPAPHPDDPTRTTRHWTLAPKTSLSACIDHVAFHPIQPLLLAIRRGQLRLLAEHQLLAGVGPDASAVQTGLAAVEVVALETPPTPSGPTGLGGGPGATTISLPQGVKPQGIALGSQHVVVWSASRAHVLHAKEKVAVAEFGHAAEVMYVLGDQVLAQVSLTHVLLGNLAGKTAVAVQCSLTPEDEVVASSVMGDMVAVMTKSGCVTVVQGGGGGTLTMGQTLVSMKDLGPLVSKALKDKASALPVVGGSTASLAWCTQIAVNSTGSHVALTCTVGSGDVLVVYARDTASVSIVPIQPVRLMFDSRDARLLVVETRTATAPTSSAASPSPSRDNVGPNALDEDEDAGTLHAFFVDGPDVFTSTTQPHRGRLLAVRSPYLFLLPPDSSTTTHPGEPVIQGLIVRLLLADFADLTLSTSPLPRPTTTSLASSSTNASATISPTVLLDRKLVQGMLDFRLALARNQLDLAFQLMPVRSSKAIWLTLAAMCVKSRQVQAVMQCLAHAGHAMGVRLVREALRDTTGEHAVEALGVAAQVLGLDDEAERVYVEAGRWDLVVRMVARGAMADNAAGKRAVELAKAKDRLGVPRAFYDAGMALAKLDPDHASVVGLLEHSDAHDVGLPRYLLSGPSTATAASAYLTRDAAPAAHVRYRAQWAEAQGDLVGALALYTRAGDTHAVVRVHCELGNVREARECAEAHLATCPAGAYHLAQFFERSGKVKDAVAWYGKARCVARAIALAKEHGLVDEVMSLALRAAAGAGMVEVVLDAARWFEGLAAQQAGQGVAASPTGRKQSPTSRSPSRATTATRRGSSKSPVPHGPTHMERAIRLYLKAGHAAKALDLAVDEHLFDLVLDVVNSVSRDTNTLDSGALARIADFMLLHHQHQKAVDLYLVAGQVDRALQVCTEHQVLLTESWVDQAFGPLASTSPGSVWAKVADACMAQGLYELASKKYTLAGDKVGAIKALIKQGNVDQVVFFASVSGAKNKDMYVLAANFLQTRDWRADTALLKHIVTFYTKAKAFEHLSSFFETCAQIEVDEYSSYEKALGALKEAHKCTSKSTHASKAARLMLLERKMDLIAKFVAAQQAAAAVGTAASVEETLQQCAALLNDPDVEIAVRAGDIYALLVETYLTQGLAPQAREIYTRMLGAVPLRLVPYYLDAGALAVVDPEFKQRLAAANAVAGTPTAANGEVDVGKPGGGRRPGTAAASEVDEEGVEEDMVASEPSRGLGV